MSDFVLDNSVTMRWCFDSGSQPYADQVLYKLTMEGDRAIVPPLWRYEVSAVIARAQIKGFLVPQKADDFIEDLNALDICIDEDSVPRVLSDVHQLALRYRLTSYDAAYLECALRRGLPLATLDRELIVACTLAGAAIF